MKTSKTRRIYFFITLILVALGFTFTVWASYPGFMSPDTLDQYTQAKSGHYSDWHPPFMAWVWHLLLNIHDSQIPFLLLFNLLFWTSIFLISLTFRPLGRLLFLVLAFTPTLINFIGVIWKDSFLLSLLFLVCALLIYGRQHPGKASWRTARTIFCLLLCFAATMLRYNAIAAVLPLSCLIFIQHRDQVNLRTVFFYPLLSSLLCFWAGSRVNQKLAAGRIYPEQQLMIYDLMGISHYMRQSIFPAYLKDKLTLDKVDQIYNHTDGGSEAVFGLPCVTDNKTDIDSLKKKWKQQVMAHPGIVLKHKRYAFDSLMSHPNLKFYYSIQSNTLGFTLPEKNVARDQLISLMENETTLWLYNGWVYLIATLSICLLSTLLFWFRRNISTCLPLFISLSGLLYLLSYFPLSPSNDFRYLYWSIGASIIGIALLAAEIAALLTRKKRA